MSRPSADTGAHAVKSSCCLATAALAFAQTRGDALQARPGFRWTAR